MAIASIDPWSNQLLEAFPVQAPEAVEASLARAAAAFESFRVTPIAERAQLLIRTAELLEAERDELAALMTREMGKLLREARDEVTKCARTLRFYAERGPSMLECELVDGAEGRIDFEPLGVILAVMPWNFPFWQVLRFAAPAILAGNVGLLKHASNVPGCARALVRLFERAGASTGVFQSLFIESERVAPLLKDPRLAALTLTGSEMAGRAMGAAAGAELKPSVLELGGNDPFIVLTSADVPLAIEAGIRARLVNNGQSCIAAKRFIVVEQHYQTFRDGMVAKMASLKLGDPMLETTDLGPLASRALRDELSAQVARLVALGARLLLGGVVPEGPGNGYPATVLDHIDPSWAEADEELFGPVAMLYSVRDAAQALELANHTRFGLGASVWTRERAEAELFARELRVGSVFVNAPVLSDPRFPFGGIKLSGYGRELGVAGLRAFVNTKTVRMRFGG